MSFNSTTSRLPEALSWANLELFASKVLPRLETSVPVIEVYGCPPACRSLNRIQSAFSPQ